MTDHRIYCWGRTDAGQLGDGTTTTVGATLCWGGALGSLPVALNAPR